MVLVSILTSYGFSVVVSLIIIITRQIRFQPLAYNLQFSVLGKSFIWLHLMASTWYFEFSYQFGILYSGDTDSLKMFPMRNQKGVFISLSLL